VVEVKAGEKLVQTLRLADQVNAAREAAAQQARQAEQQRAETAAREAVLRRYADLGGGVIRDNESGLDWTQSDNGADIDWHQANAWCNQRGDGWRLPSVDELAALYDESGQLATSCGAYTCKVYSGFRLTTPYGFYWSGTAKGSSEAWFVDLLDGHRYSIDVSISDDERALCVRRP